MKAFILILILFAALVIYSCEISSIEPTQCDVKDYDVGVLVLASAISDRQFITCNAQIVCKGVCPFVFWNYQFWQVNPHSKQAWVCRNSLRDCELYY